jgi:nucleotide-binding universal stress UspA family protein
MRLTSEDVTFCFLSFEGPDRYARAGGLGVRVTNLSRTLAAAGAPFGALIDAVPGHDAVVIGERAPSFRSFVFGDESERVAAASVGPVLVVRDRRESDGDEANATPERDEG